MSALAGAPIYVASGIANTFLTVVGLVRLMVTLAAFEVVRLGLLLWRWLRILVKEFETENGFNLAKAYVADVDCLTVERYTVPDLDDRTDSISFSEGTDGTAVLNLTTITM